jgi:hypothetical protein
VNVDAFMHYFPSPPELRHTIQHSIPLVVLFNAQLPILYSHTAKKVFYLLLQERSMQCNENALRSIWMTDVYKATTNHPNLHAKFFGLGGPENFTNVSRSQALESVRNKAGYPRYEFNMGVL